ncbi:MAG: hypothetical protein Q7R52_00570 [archaeon]|nr:hypothetical protein [archaeon]
MKITTLGLVGLLALATIKGCPNEKYDASKVNQFETGYVHARGIPSPETLPGRPTDYFLKDIDGDGVVDAVCTYEGGNVFYAKGHKDKIEYSRIMPGSAEAKILQKSNPNLEIRAGN